MKKIFLVTLLLLLSFNSVSYGAKFATKDNSMLGSTKSATRQAANSANDTQKIESLKTRADAEIDRRIAALNVLITRLGEMKKVSSTQVSAFKAGIQSNIDGLTTLKAKIDADTDLETLKVDVKSIVTDYYIFAFYIQYVNLSAALDRALVTVTNATAVYTKLSTRVTEAGVAGKDVTTLNTTLLSMKTKIDSAKTSVDAATTELATLTKDGFPANKSTLLDARAKLKAARQSLMAAVVDAKTIIKSLRAMEKVSATVTVVPTLAPTETPAQ